MYWPIRFEEIVILMSNWMIDWLIDWFCVRTYWADQHLGPRAGDIRLSADSEYANCSHGNSLMSWLTSVLKSPSRCIPGYGIFESQTRLAECRDGGELQQPLYQKRKCWTPAPDRQQTLWFRGRIWPESRGLARGERVAAEWNLGQNRRIAVSFAYPFTPELSKSTFSEPFKEKMYKWGSENW